LVGLPAGIEQKGQQWSNWTADQCRRAGKIGGAASIKKQKASAPSVPKHVMAGSGFFAANANEQMSSEGGAAAAAALANAQRRRNEDIYGQQTQVQPRFDGRRCL
jgi:hypothetical protein